MVRVAKAGGPTAKVKVVAEVKKLASGLGLAGEIEKGSDEEEGPGPVKPKERK